MLNVFGLCARRRGAILGITFISDRFAIYSALSVPTTVSTRTPTPNDLFYYFIIRIK